MQEKNERHCTGIFLCRFNQSTSEYEIALIQSEKFRHHSTGELLWTIPGGKIGSQDQRDTIEERVLACAKREVREELGIDLESVQYFPELNRQKTGTQIGYKNPGTEFYFYECIAPYNGSFVPGVEVLRVQWFSLKALPEQIAEDLYELLIEQIISHTEKYFQK